MSADCDGQGGVETADLWFRLLAHNATALTREFVSRWIDAVEKDPNVFEVDGVPISTITRWTATAKARLERLERS